MVDGAKRQLPSWMTVRSVASNDETKPIVHDQEIEAKPEKKVSESRRSRKAKPIKPGNVGKPGKRIRQGKEADEEEEELSSSFEIRKCVASRSRSRLLKERGKDDEGQGGDDDDHSRRKKKKKAKGKEFMAAMVECVSNGDDNDGELTVDDLVSIAEEYVNADEKEEVRKSQGIGFEPETKPGATAISKFGSEEDPTIHLENGTSVSDKQPSADSLMEPLFSGRNISNPSTTRDIARDMLDIYFGPLLKNLK